MRGQAKRQAQNAMHCCPIEGSIEGSMQVEAFKTLKLSRKRGY